MTERLTFLHKWRWFSRRRRPRIRHGRAAVAVLLMLSLGLCEPLACIFHCALWMPLHAQSATIVHEGHHHHDGTAHDEHSPVNATEVLAQLIWAPQARETPTFLDMQPGHGSHNHHAPPSLPLHEMALIVCLIMAVVLLVQCYTIPPWCSPLRRVIYPPLRPPIA